MDNARLGGACTAWRTLLTLTASFFVLASSVEWRSLHDRDQVPSNKNNFAKGATWKGIKSFRSHFAYSTNHHHHQSNQPSINFGISVMGFHKQSSTSTATSLSRSTSLRERRGVTMSINFARQASPVDIPAKGQLGPTAGSLPRRRRRVVSRRDSETS